MGKTGRDRQRLSARSTNHSGFLGCSWRGAWLITVFINRNRFRISSINIFQLIILLSIRVLQHIVLDLLDYSHHGFRIIAGFSNANPWNGHQPRQTSRSCFLPSVRLLRAAVGGPHYNLIVTILPAKKWINVESICLWRPVARAAWESALFNATTQFRRFAGELLLNSYPTAEVSLSLSDFTADTHFRCSFCFVFLHVSPTSHWGERWFPKCPLKPPLEPWSHLTSRSRRSVNSIYSNRLYK